LSHIRPIPNRHRPARPGDPFSFFARKKLDRPQEAGDDEACEQMKK
jgi:hypothetical protein